MNSIKGYKVFESDWTCRDFQYEVGKTYEMDEKPMCCDRGFHFCPELKDCFNYYSFDPENKIAEIIAEGEVDGKRNGDKGCTNKITIVRELTWEEVLRMVNIGKGNAGLCNSGNWNSGNCNSGNWNSGNCNSGNCNSGNWNSGNRNSGDWNSGNWNSGDWNKTCFSNGCFNTEEPTIFLFNKPSDWTYHKWLNSEARRLLNCIPKDVVEWIWSRNMTEEEKTVHLEHETTEGYLKVLDESESVQVWWISLPERDKNTILSIPNFDAAIFKQITEIDVDQLGE